MDFGNPLGFWAFISLVILVIIYLIRPKPKDVTIPSLMFVMKEIGRNIKSSFFEKLLRNILFFLQLLALAMLAFALTHPTISVPYDSTGSKTAIVLDVSASMKAESNARFERAVDVAKNSMKGDISIILAGDTPFVALDNSDEGDAKSILSEIAPKDVETNLGDAMLLAKDLLRGEEGRVLVLSDFIYTEGPDPNVVKKVLEANKAVVDFVNTASDEKKSNIGIIDLRIGKFSTEVAVKNFNDKEEKRTVSVINNNKEIKKVSMALQPESISTFSFETPEGQTEIRINEKDDFDADNIAYLSAPERMKVNVLYITNKPNKYLVNALESAKNVKVEIAEPPLTPRFDGFDVVILGEFDQDKILTGTFEDLRRFLDKGKGVVIAARPDMMRVDYEGLLPVELVNKSDKISTRIFPYAETNEEKYGFTEEESIDFGSANQYFVAKAKNGSVIYAITADSSPIIASMKVGAGNVFYYGVLDEFSSFKSTPYYPIFWNELLNSLIGAEDIKSYNFKTGKIILLGEETEVRTPSGKMSASSIVLDKCGFYTFKGRTIAANLLSDKESNINKKAEIQTVTSSKYKAEKVEKRKDVEIDNYLILAALLAIIAEIAIVKYRGDI
ncbi:MAG: BatA and WFA domain-containing protein [Candidatus Woesearchaeota archaeon]|nr:BatA and WFA domain-containing protein [Candidatus Woesearchaeota archaeon]